jgi:hypothetical protein
MAQFRKILTVFMLAGIFLVPLSASAITLPFLSFGGRITSTPIPCMSSFGLPALWISIAPFGIPGTIPPAIIVTLPTIGSTIPPIPTKPPFYPFQQILGTYSIPGVCVTPAGIVLPGVQSVTQNTETIIGI